MKFVNRSLVTGLVGMSAHPWSTLNISNLGHWRLTSQTAGAGLVAGKPTEICPSAAGGICYSIAIPTSSANSGIGNIYFQISAPTSFQWVALGTGRSMSGSNIFLMYQDGGGNVTLSPRQAGGYTMPVLDTSNNAARLTLLAGSGVSADGSTMTANVACANCQSWNGGEMSLASTGAPWISAWKQGSSLATTNRAAIIQVHDGHSQFRVDLTQATISSDSNPFTTTRSGGSGASGGGGGSGSGSGSSNGFFETTTMDRSAVLAAHGIIMALVMAIFYPVGSLLMPLLQKWWVHGAWQAMAYILMWAGFGLGVTAAKQQQMVGDSIRHILDLLS